MTHRRSRPRETVQVLYDHELQNAAGKSIIGIEVTYPPDGFTPPHRHSGTTVVARATEGSILSGFNGEPPRVYGVGESFMESPGCHHTVGENSSNASNILLLLRLPVYHVLQDSRTITWGPLAGG